MVGSRVGNYEVRRILAHGGMAVVYLAHQPALGRDVALKVLDLDRGDPSMAARFVREARLSAGLDHPNIVTLLDFFEADGVACIAMELVGGGSLRRRMPGLDTRQAVSVLDGVLAGLAHAERHCVSHRDLKPENVLLTTDGTPKIADFGIARAYEEVTERLTDTGVALGTPAYMAPEQVQGLALGPQTDLYALGVIAYELLAGATPFPDDDGPLAVLYRHVHEPVPALRPRAPAVPEELCAWVEELLAKAPADRPPSAAAAREELEELAVAAFGPYWRRGTWPPAQATTAESSVAAGAHTPMTVPRAVTERPEPPAATHRARRIGAGVAVAAAASVIAWVAVPHDDAAAPPARNTPRPPPERIVALAHAGGVTLLRGGPAETLRTLSAPSGAARTDFGAAAAGGDFDGDGRGDLAVGAPAPAGPDAAREGSVTIRYDAAAARGRTQTLSGFITTWRGGRAGYGTALAAGDLDDDGFDDLVIGVPGGDGHPSSGGSGVVQVRYGGRDGLGTSRPLRRPSAATSRFGIAVAVGDLDGDRRLDVVAAARGADAALASCRGTRNGPSACRALPGTTGAATVAVIDVTGDGREDVVAGCPSCGAGAVTVLRGTRRGAPSRAVTITQDEAFVPGNDQPEDAFGAALATADFDEDGHGDVVIGAPGEDHGAGRVTVMRGGARGFSAVGNFEVHQSSPNVPGPKRTGRRFGATVGATDVDRDDHADLLVGVPGWGPGGSVLVFAGNGDGFFEPARRLRLHGGRGGPMAVGTA